MKKMFYKKQGIERIYSCLKPDEKLMVQFNNSIIYGKGSVNLLWMIDLSKRNLKQSLKMIRFYKNRKLRDS